MVLAAKSHTDHHRCLRLPTCQACGGALFECWYQKVVVKVVCFVLHCGALQAAAAPVSPEAVTRKVAWGLGASGGVLRIHPEEQEKGSKKVEKSFFLSLCCVQF